MDKVILLAELRATIAAIPDFEEYTPGSRTHQEWLGKADALLGRWNPIERVTFRMSVTQLVVRGVKRNFHLGQILTVLHRAEADLALDVPATSQAVFGPGAVYDFLKAIREILAGARTSVLIVDPYLDEQIFDVYLSAVVKGVDVRLLIRKYAAALEPTIQRFVSQSGISVNARVSNQLHDRVIFVDSMSCWVVGQSIKDAAKKSPTYVAPLGADAIKLKLDAYEGVWAASRPL